jgi:hypothetical protein
MILSLFKRSAVVVGLALGIAANAQSVASSVPQVVMPPCIPGQPCERVVMPPCIPGQPCERVVMPPCIPGQPCERAASPISFDLR